MKQPWRDTMLLEAIASRLKALRVAKGVSQETVYEDTGIHIGKIETARYNVTVSTLSKLCNYYGITLKEFFDKLGK
ncbi:MAG: helix-turn-helix transcriptional regulator [Alistipes sp.]|nr:helix-turn-helix transcriptional regulator [Alistipes sp.]